MLKSFVNLAGAAALGLAAPAFAQMQTIDPNQADSYQAAPEDQWLAEPADGTATDVPATGSEWEADSSSTSSDSVWVPTESNQADSYASDPQTADPYAERAETAPTAAGAAAPASTVPREDVFTAAEGLFGRGAEGLAGILENILREQGEPTAYISGQEASGAFVLGVRYGSGTMRHQIEGDRVVYWTGPSIGFDVGADANKVFVLVYNLHDSQDLFRRFPGAEGNAYFVGGFTAQYMRHGDIVLIPIRLGVGLRLGINAGYMRFSERNRWLPF
ncbi:DUF1134 domain-containing protein [Sphingosinicella sp. CPCC 101087]|uniref:DUF1134 domain-containing protein n=1 Tax=Sphingosinicella sp. CPCC 101087 TaxID=2497754 RepID=UPI00101D72AF|nr:DUF1134 domain-containing protein [Sphingosinicella sp. CPCC 101087]